MTLPNKEEMEIAMEIARHFREDVAFGPLRQEALAKTIATALHEAAEEATLIERERCAKVAEFHEKKEFLIKGKSDSWAQGNNTACLDIAAAIRRQTKP